MLTGSVNTKVKHKLALEAPIGTKLVAFVDENTSVKKGDIVARFETEDLQTRIEDLKQSLENMNKDLLIYYEELAILVTSNAADVRSAEDSVATALDNYNRYRKLDGQRDKNTQLLSVSDAAKALEDAITKYNTAYNNLNQMGGSVPKASELENMKKALVDAEKAWDSASVKYKNTLGDRKVFKRYTYPTKVKDVKNRLEQARLDLDRVKVRTTSSLAQKNNQIYNLIQNIKRVEREQLGAFLFYMSNNMQLLAPVDGIVTYGDPDQRWRPTELKVGMDISRGQVLITIPDMSIMIVDVNIPEQYRSKVSIGDELIITPDSIPNLKLPGKIKTIASLPVLLVQWDPASPKVYRSQVEFNLDDTRVVTGMSVQVEVISQIKKDVLFVPIEAVHEEGGKFFVYRETSTKPENVFVELGISNDSFVEIISGLSEGDEVYLYRPFQTSKE